jgi:hypothetical protein
MVPHAVLGTMPGAPLALLDRLYWGRVRRLIEAEARREPDAHELIEQLNAAHAEVRTLGERRPRRAPAASKGQRAARPARTRTPLVAALAAAIGVLGLRRVAAPQESDIRGTRRRLAARNDALATLYLAPGAVSYEIRIAYDTLRESALADRSQGDTALLDRLERLEHAYQSAMSSGGTAYRRS